MAFNLSDILREAREAQTHRVLHQPLVGPSMPSVRVIRADFSEYTAVCCELELDGDTLRVVTVHDGFPLREFPAGTWKEGFDGAKHFIAPIREFDETDLALGRDH